MRENAVNEDALDTEEASVVADCLVGIVAMRMGIATAAEEATLGVKHDAVLTARGPEGALEMLKYLYNTSARQFASPVHRERVYAGFASQVERKFGVRFIPPERAGA